MKMYKRLLAATLMVGIVALCGAAQAAETLKPKVDNFILFVDHSGSMAMTSPIVNEVKIKNAKELIARMNAEIPALGYKSSVATFAPYATLLAPVTYTKAAVAKADSGITTDYEIFGRNTPMGPGLASLDPLLAQLPGRTAVILFTDGDANYGSDPVAEAKALYAKYNGRICFHVVSYADNAQGKMVVDGIRAISRCSVPGDPKALENPGALKKFVRDVFYDTVVEEPAPVRAAPAQKCETITFGNLNFDFDKYAITPQMEPALEQGLTLLKSSACHSFTITGHTDNVGTVPYNQKLSERRAASVAHWFIDHGFPASRLRTQGKGKLEPKFDNGTPEGRHMNRRVEITND